MPELPEVEYAARIARAACQGKRIREVRSCHPSQRRTLPDVVARTLAGDVVREVRRCGKHQLFQLASGRTIHVHFRMTGDWSVGEAAPPVHRFARVILDFDDGTRLALVDTRALSHVSVHEAGESPLPDLGPEATAPEFDAAWLAAHLARRRAPVKPILLDQRVVAGIGNIYASEALWYARVDPRRPAHRLSSDRVAAIVAGVKRTMRKALAHPERYHGADAVRDAVRFNVYDREGRPCRRCRAPISRLTQAGRSTYFCRSCQKG
ncbi:MAG TPA: bifunctional DNA-formamidopyrimidine glycosylase/DNA-(apurinic or apyrimidinic site) lyase [Gemmatimonadaceae bacterium]|nr:bifunctional DNA-formamidopyrimidine glycosylase/DNA-(apurinic or apyrimidinic site) lyase [Gemmatimonadaceae bacterium]